jgi:hypothetical protein
VIWQPSDFVPHLAAPVRIVDVEFEDLEQPVARVRLALRAPTPVGQQPPVPRVPAHIMGLVLPEAHEMDLPGQPAQVRAEYEAVAAWEGKYSFAEVLVACAPSVGTTLAIDSLITRYERTIGVLTEEGTCAVARREGYRGPGRGRVITLGEPEGAEPGPSWLYPSALHAYLTEINWREYQRAGQFVDGVHELPDPPRALLVEYDGHTHRVEVLNVESAFWAKRAFPRPETQLWIFKQLWNASFPNQRFPLLWAMNHSTDPYRVPPPPFAMTESQHARLAEIWYEAFSNDLPFR